MEHSTEQFIEKVKSHNILWDLTNSNYKNVKKKAGIWKNISEEFGLTFEASKKKWKGLRDSYARDLAKKPTSGQAAEDPDTKWKYHDQMDFLREHQKPRPTKSNIEPSQQNIFEDIAIGSDGRALIPPTEDGFAFSPNLISPDAVFPISSMSPDAVLPISSLSPDGVRPVSSLSSQGPKKRQRSMEATFVTTMQSVQDFLKKPRPAPIVASVPDEDDLFSQCISAKIKRFPIHLKNQVKLEVLRYVSDVETLVPAD